MLKEILSISGKSGLYKLISQGKNMFITESLIDKKRIPVYASDKSVSLGDIAIYTEDEEVPLINIFNKIKEKENGEKITLDPSIKPEELRNYFAEILPEFDRDRVYPSDIKKIINWYNILVNAGLTQFDEEEKEEEKENNLPENEPETKE
jgi:hypothetical protein